MEILTAGLISHWGYKSQILGYIRRDVIYFPTQYKQKLLLGYKYSLTCDREQGDRLRSWGSTICLDFFLNCPYVICNGINSILKQKESSCIKWIPKNLYSLQIGKQIVIKMKIFYL